MLKCDPQHASYCKRFIRFLLSVSEIPARSPSQQRCVLLLDKYTLVRAHTTHSQTHTQPCFLLGLCQHWVLIKCFRFKMKDYVRSETFFFFLSMKELCAYRICTDLHHNTIPSSSEPGCKRALELNERSLNFYPVTQ